MSLLLLLPALYITFLTYKSLIAQTKVNRDMKKENPETKWQEIINIFPPIPNMNMYCFPISHIKAFYLMKDKKYDQALSLLNNNASVNPFLTLTEFFKAKIFFETNKTDSAFIYAKKAFFGKPRARSNYEILNTISIKLNDTTMLTQAFKEYTKYRNEPWAWNRYLEIMMSIQQNRQPLIPLADSAFKMFPDDPDLQQKKNILGNTNQPLPITKEQDDLFRNYFVAGLEAFTNNNYSIAIQNFTKAAKVNPGDYVAVENIGVCYFSMKEYSRAISYLDKVLQRKISTDGKAEFLKGVCLLNVGKKEEGCSYLNIANNKNYKDAKAYIQNNCTDKK